MTSSHIEEQRGKQAEQVLNNEIYKEAFESVRLGILDAWQNSPIRDKEGQHELKLMHKLLVDVQKNMENVMQTGKLARLQIERDTMMEKAKNIFKRAA